MSTMILAVVLAAAADPKPVTLRVLTYNIHHGEGTDGKIDLPRLAKVIAAAEPDFVALQEVDDRCKRSGGVDQTAELARLTKLHGRFGKAIDYDGGGYGQAILSRFPLPEVSVHLLPGVPDRERRVAVAARVRVGDGGPEVTFATTHLHHLRADFREQQAEELNRMFGATGGPVILAGDLNATPEAKPLDVLKAKWTVAVPQEGTYPSGKPTKVIDYVLARPGGRFRVIETRVIDEPTASDHRPVLVVVELRP